MSIPSPEVMRRHKARAEAQNKAVMAAREASAGTTGHQATHMRYPNSDSMPMKMGSDKMKRKGPL